jgi:hypothetical protein
MATTYPTVARWLHRHGIARTISSSSSSTQPNVRYLMESRPWTPRWLVIWAANTNFRQLYASSAANLHLATVQRHQVAMDRTRRWSLHYRPTVT